MPMISPNLVMLVGKYVRGKKLRNNYQLDSHRGSILNVCQTLSPQHTIQFQYSLLRRFFVVGFRLSLLSLVNETFASQN